MRSLQQTRFDRADGEFFSNGEWGAAIEFAVGAGCVAILRIEL
ncbi:hypothetical protein [Arthrobacter sp. AET 35A]|nr:hypothetical protein [Arthrobacter sp. AET 35A]